MKEQLIGSGAGNRGAAVLGSPAEQNSTSFLSAGMRARLGSRSWQVVQRLAAQIMTFPPILNAALREIFDESAYARFLNQRQMASSRQAYASFRREHEMAKARRPRCC